ncbi:ATP-binding protein [Dechloromonas sp. ZY10]|uniref:ATP-binding protein n=1 Tax=Dechloromonas aquae TaxID=2664436 RepID=UPI0035294E0C
MAARSKPESLIPLIALVGTLAVFVVLLADLYLSRQREIESGERRLQHFSVMMAEHTARSFEAIDILLREVATDLSQNRSDWEGWEPARGWEYMAQRHSRAMPQLRDLIIFDRQGNQRFISTYFPPPHINVRDRPYFAQLENGANVSTFGPYIGRNSGRYTYALARRIVTPGGQFAGAAFAAVEPAYLQDFCWYNRLSDDFEALLINSKGEVVASCRPTDMSKQSPILGTRAEDSLFDGQLAGRLGGSGIVSHGGLMASLSPVPSFPDLRIVAVIPEKTLLANWQGRMLELTTLGFLLGGLLLTIAMLVRRQFRAMAQMTEELQASRQMLEDRVREATQKLEAQKNEAERANKAKSRFLAAASHDLRQPLHALSLFSADLLRQVSNGVTHTLPRLAEQIAQSTSVLGELLDSLLDISRLDVAGIKPEIHGAALNPVFERLASSFRRTAIERGLRLRVRATRLWVETDPLMLERILVNLLANALRYTPKGGTILLAARRRGRGVVIEVRDSGIGIATEHQAAIFAEFYQVGNSAREQNKGLGLGLSIVDRLVRALEIRIELKSRPGEGTRFSLWLPEARENDNRLRELMAVAGDVCLIGQHAQFDLIESLLRSWDYRTRRHTRLEDAALVPERTVIVDYPVLRQLGSDSSGLALICVLPETPVSLPPGVHPLPLPVRPAKLRALLRACSKA